MAADVSEEYDKCRLSEVGRFATHVWASDELALCGVGERDRIGHDGHVPLVVWGGRGEGGSGGMVGGNVVDGRGGPGRAVEGTR